MWLEIKLSSLDLQSFNLLVQIYSYQVLIAFSQFYTIKRTFLNSIPWELPVQLNHSCGKVLALKSTSNINILFNLDKHTSNILL